MPLLPSPLPLVAAPMAGGVSTPELVDAVARTGAFGFLAAGYRSPAGLGTDLARLSAAGVDFGVNLFVPEGRPADPAEIARYAEALRPDFAAHGLEPDPHVIEDDDGWAEKLDLLCAHPVPVVSFTFALPDAESIARLRGAGSATLMTVTSPSEARAAVERGVDGVIVQSWAAGGHSAVWDPTALPDRIPLTDLVRSVRAVVDVPVLAAGGIDGRDAVEAVLGAGAEAAVVGTLFLRTTEAGTSATHRSAVRDGAGADTVLTRAYTGRPARGLRTAFIAAHDTEAPVAYPAVHHLTSPLRRAAARAGDRERLHLWAGTGCSRARDVPAAEVVAELIG